MLGCPSLALLLVLPLKKVNGTVSDHAVGITLKEF